MKEKCWNNPKPTEWKAEELSQGRIIDYKAFNFVDGKGSATLCMFLAVSFTVRVATMRQLGRLKLEYRIPKS